MNLEAVEILALTREGTGHHHWSQNVTRPRYSLTKEEVKEAEFTHRFTCFDVAERVETDHDVLLAGRSNGSVVLWRMVPRNMFGGSNKNDRVEEHLSTSSPHKGAVTCITHTPAETYGLLGAPLVFTGSVDHTIKIWKAWGVPHMKEACVQTIADQRGGLSALAFAGDGTLIASSRDGNTRLWRPLYSQNVSKNPVFCCVKSLSPHMLTGQLRTSASVWCTTSCVAGDEKWTLYLGDSDGTVSVFHRTPASFSERLAYAVKKPNGDAIQQLAHSEITLLRRWNHLHSLAITKLLLVPDHNFLVSMGNDGVCKILNYLQGTILSVFESRRQSIFTSVAWDLTHELLVLADASGTVQMWNTYTKSLLLREQVAKPFAAKGPRRGHSALALLGFHSSKADGMLYGMSPSENCFFQWKIVKAEGYAIIGHHRESIVGLGFQETLTPSTDMIHHTANERDHDHSSEGATGKGKGQEGDIGLSILSVSVDGKISAWETEGECEKYQIQHSPDEEVASMVVLSGGRLLATGTDNGRVKFWRLDSGTGESFEAHSNTVCALATTSDCWRSLMFASGCFEGTIVLWTVDGLKDDTKIPRIDFAVHGAHGGMDGSNSEVLCLAFVSSDTPLLASAGNDLVVKCWHLEAHNAILVATLKGHRDSIEGLVADGLHLLSASCDGMVRVWNVSTIAIEGRGAQGTPNSFEACGPVCVAMFEAHPGGVAAMDIISKGDVDIRDGMLVTSAKKEGVVKIWDYTHVEEDGTCGRLVSEISTPKRSLVCCFGCYSHVEKGYVRLYVGTTEGAVLELSSNVVEGATGSSSDGLH